MNILVVEDDAPLWRSLAASLGAAGHEAHWAPTGAAALAACVDVFDAMILDIGLPDIDGFEILCRLRRQRADLPILVLTARDAVPDRVAGLDMGADDYVLKPFEPDELVARLRAVVRRRGGASSNVLVVGALTCDLEAGSALIAGRPLDLRPREWTALRVLASRAGRTVSREQLAAEMVPTDGTVSANLLDVHIGRLRRKLAPDGPRVRTLRGVGYRLDP